MVISTALAAVVGVMAPGPATAQPLGAVASTGGIGTGEAQRVDAAAVVRLEPSPDVLLLSDYDFIHALWQKAKDGGGKLESVRTAAEEAMASTSAEDHVQFIITGIHKAYELDKKREKDQADVDRAAREARSQALLAVGISSTPELLALSDENFILAIAGHSAAGPEVRAAARRALAGDFAARREFIVNGAREAHQRDVANKLKELEERDREEAERRKALAARTAAAALFRITPSEAMLALSDDNFIRELLRSASADAQKTELYSAGQRAVLSSDPAEWKKFIYTGAEQAYKRDDEARRKKIADSNRKLALQIQAAAENGGVNLNLVAEAKKALAGSDEDVAEFLKDESQYRAKRQSLRGVTSKRDWYIRRSHAEEDGDRVFVAPMDAKSQQANREDATWVVLPALANNPGCYSFESVNKPGHYLASEGELNVWISSDDGSSQFRERATWCPRRGLIGYGTSFESANNPGKWMATYRDGITMMDMYFTDYAQKSSWEVSPPLAR
ncbi:AbfB domain-containing protein [Streptomyces albireticuli]|uniref:AbfB domain-containing protein n=1 Tax=Streptomyces albireticuli TaxID=1940 RepID=UPI0036BEBBF2